MIAPIWTAEPEPAAARTDRAVVPNRLWNQALHNPVNSFLLGHGKRIRAELVGLAFRIGGGQGQAPAQLERFVELLHAGSLVIDDIEDGARLRRGTTTLHLQIGVPLAINTGNWMYFAALENLTSLSIAPSQQLRMLRTVLATVRRCHEGQALDLASRASLLQAPEARPTANAISRLKTGGLLALSTWLGGLVSQANSDKRRVLAKFGLQLGVALQMQNDLAELRRCALRGESSDDLRNERVTWAWAWAAPLPEFPHLQDLIKKQELKQLAPDLWEAVHTLGTAAIRQRLRHALAGLQRVFGNSTELKQVAAIVEQLEKNYA